MSENQDVDESAQNNRLCWVHTKWGRYQAQIIMETMQDEGHFVIVNMINSAFEVEESIKVFKIDQIEYI